MDTKTIVGIVLVVAVAGALAFLKRRLGPGASKHLGRRALPPFTYPIKKGDFRYETRTI